MWDRLKRVENAYWERVSRPRSSALDRWHVRRPVLASAVISSPLWLLLPMLQIAFLDGPVLMWLGFSLVGVLMGCVHYNRARSKRERNG